MHPRFALVTFLVASATLASGSAFAQGAAPSSGGSADGRSGTAPGMNSPATPSPPAPGSTGMDKGMGTGTSSQGGQSTHATPTTSTGALSGGDRTFVQAAAEGSKAEVASGQMAQAKGSSDTVKQFGRRMATDHQKAYDQLAQIGGAKGITVPGEPSKAHQREAAKLDKLSGSDFDREYAKTMVADHKKDVSEFRKQSKSAKDPDVRAFAATTLPTLDDHLRMAQEMESAVRKARTAQAGR